MKPFAVKTALVLSLLAAAGCSRPPPPPTVQTATVQAPTKSADAILVTDTLRVVSVNRSARSLTLRGNKGRTFTVEVAPEAQNFEMIRRGDLVTVQYFQSVAFTLNKAGEPTPPNTAAVGAEVAPPGNLPAGVAARRITVTGLVTAVDLDAHTVTVVNPNGGPQRTIQVLDPQRQQDLAHVNVGDTITATITQAVAVSVEKASSSSGTQRR